MSDPARQAEDVRKVYQVGGEEVAAVDGISLSVERGELVALMGPSGSGKSTLRDLFAGLERPSSGRVRIDGQDLALLTEDGRARLPGCKVGFVSQTFNLTPARTLAENVALPQILDGVSASVWGPKAEQAPGRVGLAHRARHLPDQSSVGEQQSAALARVLAQLRTSASELGAPVRMVTDDAAASVADRTLLLRDGRLEPERCA